MVDLFFLIIVACLAVSAVQSFFNHSRSSQRRIYWSCAVVAAAAGFLSTYPDWNEGVEIALFLLGTMIVIAFVYTPYIKLGGKIHALSVQDSQPDPDPDDAGASETDNPKYDPAPDAYSGLLTATKLWWLLLSVLVISSGNIYAFATGDGEGWVATMGIAFLIFLAFPLGYGDASWGYGIARGQLIQFVIAGVITVGVFTVLYLVSYHAGKSWPLRRKQSMEYRAHPRHRKLD